LKSIGQAFAAPSAMPSKTGGRFLSNQMADLLRRHWSIEGLALFLYISRDAVAGAMRYYLSMVKLDPLWFIPDILAIACIFVFIYRYVFVGRGVVATVFILYVAIALMLGYIFLGTVAGLFSSLKMFAPVFVGFCFCGRKLSDYPLLMKWMRVLFYLSIIGAVTSSFITYPWMGYAYESFGATRQAGKIWYSQSELRLAGFAADSTMAGFFIMMMFVFTASRSSLLWVLIWGPIGLWAIRLTTSKTSLGVMAIFMVALIIARLLPERVRFGYVRLLGVGSFWCIAIPVILIAALSGFELTDISKSLFSLQDRIDNSWQKPFVYMAELMPIGFLTGCGLGCFNYPQQLFSPSTAKYYVAVDNFYLGTYIMFGPAFAVFMYYVIQSMRRTTDVTRLTLAFVMNIFTITIMSYGPASGLVLISYAFSEVFANAARQSSAPASSMGLGRFNALRARFLGPQRLGPPPLRPAE